MSADVSDLRVKRTRDTFYALCPTCGMDTLWPSWCKCSPQRVHHPHEFEEAQR